MSAGDPAACGSSPGLCSQQLVVVGGALVVVLSVSDDRGQAFAHQSFCDVAGEGRERENGKTRSTLAALAASVRVLKALPGPTGSAGPRDLRFQLERVWKA